METVYYSFSYTLLDALNKGKTVGERITYYRKKKKLSQRQLADLAGVSICTIKRIEGNKVESNLTTYNKVVNALQVDPDFVYNDYIKFINGDYASWIKSFRHSKKLTQRQLSELLQVHIKTVIRWEQKKLVPSREHYTLIQKSL